MSDGQGGRGATATSRAHRVRAWLEAPVSPLPMPRRLPLWILGGLVLALTALQMFRRPSAPPVWDSLIAEDGRIFLSQAISQHFLDSLATSYQGYLHTVPRGIALAVPFVPVTAHEMSGAVSNLHWYLLYAAFWAVICPWRGRGWLAASTAVVVLAVLSDPLTAVLL